MRAKAGLLWTIVAGVLWGCSGVAANPEPFRGRQDGAAIVAELRELDDADTRPAESLLWELGDTGACARDQAAVGLRFLKSPSDDVFSAAAGVLQHCMDPRIEDALRAAARNGNAFRRFRVWDVLHASGKPGVVREVEGALSDRRRGRAERKELLRRVLWIDAQALAPSYLHLLRDPDEGIRYSASKILARLCGDDFEYRYRNGAGANERAIERWRAWLEAHGSELPRQWAVPRLPGIVGVSLRMSGEQVVVVKTVPGAPAEQLGIVAGDVLFAIDHEPVRDKTMWEIIELELRGAPGTTVSIVIETPGSAAKRTFTVERVDERHLEDAGIRAGA